MIDLALDPSDTRPAHASGAPDVRRGKLRVALVALAVTGGLGAFGVAASAVMADLVAPPPPRARLAPPSRAADWPELKDGLPALADARAPVAAPAEVKRDEPVTPPPLRMATLAEPISALPTPTRAAAPVAALAPAQEPPAKRVPVPMPVTVIGPTRQVAPLAPIRTVSLQQPRPADTVRAREVADPAPVVATPAVVTPPAVSAPTAAASPAPVRTVDKPQRKAVAARKPAAPIASQSGAQAPVAVASAEAEPDEMEVLGVKLPSLAPAGRKLKESIGAIGDAVKSVF